MATATFDKRIIIGQKEADIIVSELEKTPIGPPKTEQDFIVDNEREVEKWLSSYAK